MKDKLYTAGEIAKLTGVSLRTIRFYDAKGLLKPVAHSEVGYRYYDRDSVGRLQRILVLKYLGFSLQQIEEMIKADKDIEPQLSQQKSLLLQRKRQLEEIISTIEIMEKSNGEEKWDYLLRLLSLLTDEEKIRQQYETSDNLERRIRLHEIVSAFDQRIEMPYSKLTIGFRLENGEPQLRKFFAGVKCERQENDLIVDRADAIYDYVYSYPGNAPCVLEQRGEEFREMLEELLKREGAIYIHKDTGMFICRKNIL